MPDQTDLSQTIAENAQGPESAAADGVTVKRHNLRDQIEADKYLGRKRAQKNPAKALRFARIIPPGTV